MTGAAALSGLLLGCPAPKDPAGSDPKAVALAEGVMTSKVPVTKRRLS